jgi:hypothetical protein
MLNSGAPAKGISASNINYHAGCFTIPLDGILPQPDPCLSRRPHGSDQEDAKSKARGELQLIICWNITSAAFRDPVGCERPDAS